MIFWMRAALVTSLASTLPFQASAQTRYFYVEAGKDDISISGYTRIDVQADGKITGKLCAYDDGSELGESPRLKDLGTILVEGRAQSKSLSLEFHSDGTTHRELLRMLPQHAVKLDPVASEDSNLGGLIINGPGWQVFPNDQHSPYIRLAEIPNEIKPEQRDEFAMLDDDKKLNLQKFDEMSPEQALSFVAKTKWDEAIAPTVVHAVYRPSDRSRVVEFLKQYNGIAYGPARPDCGSSYVEETFRVPALLEYFFARKLQISGLVARAYAEPVPRTPPIMELSLASTELKDKLKPEHLSVEERSRNARDFLEGQLIAFLKAKRPSFSGTWEVLPQGKDTGFVYRWQITGASISACNRTGWEKFDLQISFTLGDVITLQALDGYQAPGALTARPNDERFKDNRLDDDALEKIQDSFYNFLTRHGITSKDREFESFSAACKL